MALAFDRFWLFGADRADKLKSSRVEPSWDSDPILGPGRTSPLASLSNEGIKTAVAKQEDPSFRKHVRKLNKGSENGSLELSGAASLLSTVAASS